MFINLIDYFFILARKRSMAAIISWVECGVEVLVVALLVAVVLVEVVVGRLNIEVYELVVGVVLVSVVVVARLKVVVVGRVVVDIFNPGIVCEIGLVTIVGSRVGS